MKRILPAVITMAVGWITLATYFLPRFASVRVVLVELAIIVAAFAMILGSLNVLDVHMSQIGRRRPGWFYSFVLIATLISVLVVSALEASAAWFGTKSIQQVTQAGVYGSVMVRVYEYILIPIQATLAALLPFVLAFAAYRTLRMHSASSRASAIIFLVTAILVLVGQVPLFNLSFLSGLRGWILGVLAMAGVRGILLGVALGITATALRVLIGADRPTSD